MDLELRIDLLNRVAEQPVLYSHNNFRIIQEVFGCLLKFDQEKGNKFFNWYFDDNKNLKLSHQEMAIKMLEIIND